MIKRSSVIAIAPSYDTIEDGKDAYLHHLRLRTLTKENPRYWSFYSMPTTVALPENRFAKSLKPFSAHTTEPKFRELLSEYSEYGVPRPSNYADVFHERFVSPRVSWSVNASLAPAIAGGWQEAQCIGAHFGTFYRYDMRSAYLWAATLGLPDTTTYTRSVTPFHNGGYDGVYRLKLMEVNPFAPFPFNTTTEVLATNEEIETYELRVSQVISGVAWKRLVDPKPMIDAIHTTSTWKLAGRSYWGRWAQSTRIECHSADKRWCLPSITLNIPWAHLIVSRVRRRVWEAATRALHVYVDSVITPEIIPTGNEIGDWRLEKTYYEGVVIRGPGQYGDIRADTLEKMAGNANSSLGRRNSAAFVA